MRVYDCIKTAQCNYKCRARRENETDTHLALHAVIVNRILEDMSTELQTESEGSEATTTSEVWTSQDSSSSLPYKSTLIAIGSMGALSNGLVIVGFCLCGRSKMTSSMVHIANHTTLEHHKIFVVDFRSRYFFTCTSLQKDSEYCCSFLRAIGPAHTTLELVACVMITLRFSMDIAGLFKYQYDLRPASMAFCILVDSPSLITLGLNGGTASVVIITLDRYWRIVHSIHYRKYYRRWMLYVGLLLPWLNGIAVYLLPALGTTRIVNGKCMATAFWPTVSMKQVCFHNSIIVS